MQRELGGRLGRGGELRRQLRLAAADVAQHQRHAATSTSSTQPGARRATHQLPERQRPESVLRADADDGGGGAAGREHRARAAAPPLPAVRRGQHDDQRGRVLVQRAAGHACSGGSRRATRCPPATPTRTSRRPRSSSTRAIPSRGRSSRAPDVAAPPDGQRHLRAAVRTRAPVRRRRQRRGLGRSSAAGRSRASTPTRAASRSASATSSSPATSTTSRCRRASRRSRAGSTPTPASTRCRRSSSDRTSARSRCGSRTSAPTTSTTSICRSSRTRRCGGKTIELRFDSLNAFNHPLFPGPNTDPTAVRVRDHQRVDAGQLPAPHAGDR